MLIATAIMICIKVRMKSLDVVPILNAQVYSGPISAANVVTVVIYTMINIEKGKNVLKVTIILTISFGICL